MKKQKILEYLIIVISNIIMILSTALLPDLIGERIFTSIARKDLGIIIGVSLLIIFILVKHILDKNDDKGDVARNQDSSLSTDSVINTIETDQEKISKLNNIHTFRLFAISSAYWVDFISSKANMQIDQCTIMIRKPSVFSPPQYQEEVKLSIEKWKRLEYEGKIKRVTIVEYSHISDVYYAIFDNVAVITGLNCFDALDSTGQYGQRNSFYFYADTEEKTRIVNSYIAHFENYINYETSKSSKSDESN